MQRDGCWCLKRTLVRRCTDDDDSDIKQITKLGKGDEDASHSCVDGCHVFTEAVGEKEGEKEHHWESLDKEAKWQFLKPIALALAVSIALNHRPSIVVQVSGQPLFPQHRDECGEE